MLGVYVLFIVVLLQDARATSEVTTQIICCFVPPMALQIGTHTLLKSYPKDGLSLGTICGIMVRVNIPQTASPL